MLKKLPKVLTVFTLLTTSSLISINQFAKADETDQINIIEENDLSTLIYSGSEENAPLFKPSIPQVQTDKDSPQRVVINDGSYNWRYLNTYYESNVFSNTATSWLITAASGGIAGWAAKFFVKEVWRGVAGSIIGKAASDLKVGTNYWWTVKKYVDKDAYNVYVKYDIKIYSNSSRTKLVKSYIQVHKV
ncbi:hypothetical protein P4T37_03600 [Bacillus mobilis]|uniref:hypothetical protein n=1 Tax=Bacillus mobilis TaxID=2026190 RepID=UPI002E1A97D4|nr:hypothetical protein [Bacillus mobilis]